MWCLRSQTNISQGLLFPEYEKGTAFLKSGIRAQGLYNYSLVSREIYYLDENRVAMTFENPDDIASVIIADRIFENTRQNGFLERIDIGSGFYYVRWEAKWLSKGKSTGDGRRVQSHGITNYKISEDGTVSAPRYTYDEGMTILPEISYYLKKDDEFVRFYSVSSLSKAIGCCKKELKTWVKKEHIDFKNPEDVQRMMILFLKSTSVVRPAIYDFIVKTIDGDDFSLSSLKGKKVMIVNVASRCGLTPQYAQLQDLYEKNKSNNFVIIGFPANNFGAQEPGSNEEIKDFCTVNYGVTFPMMAKISVKGEDIAPLYRWLTSKSENGVDDAEVTWNFQKFLIDAEGHWVKSIAPNRSPQSEEIISWIEEGNNKNFQ
jgi:glutathione peroxidase